MHPSYFLLLQAIDNDSVKDFQLLAEVSEWLFHIGFWERFNRKNQTQFAQYEEEVLPRSLIVDFTDTIKALINELVHQSVPEVNFLYGWDSGRNGIYCTVSTALLIENLGRFVEFLKYAKEVDLEVYCQL